MKIRASIKILGAIHNSRRARVSTWKLAVTRYKQYRRDGDWIEELFQRLFMACSHGPRSIRPLRELRDEIAERSAMRSDTSKGKSHD
jgi:hypothetical protein